MLTLILLASQLCCVLNESPSTNEVLSVTYLLRDSRDRDQMMRIYLWVVLIIICRCVFIGLLYSLVYSRLLALIWKTGTLCMPLNFRDSLIKTVFSLKLAS